MRGGNSSPFGALAKRMAAALAILSLGGCAYTRGLPSTTTQPVYPKKTDIQLALNLIPPPGKPIAVAVYGFSDQTGQFKPSETTQTLSRAVTQGAGSILVKSLQDAGNRQWFTIVEREQLRNLLNERQIIREMRERYLGETNVNPQALPALLFAGVLLEGGIIGYDTNTLTGGVGASFLGIGAHTEYQQHTATVYLRAVSVRTGEVLTSVTTSKTIASYGISASAFRYVAFKELLEAEGGVTTNEPGTIALQQAIEKAVYGLVMEGVELKLWDFADSAAGAPFLLKYRD
ncbi:CsgG/HfaB family protein, partial [Sphingomonas solaris]